MIVNKKYPNRIGWISLSDVNKVSRLSGVVWADYDSTKQHIVLGNFHRLYGNDYRRGFSVNHKPFDIFKTLSGTTVG